MFNIGGEKLMSLRESLEYELNHRVSLKENIPWSEGDYETDFLQPRLFSNGEVYYAPMASPFKPVYMPATPVGDTNWKLIPKQDEELLYVSSTQPQSRLSEQSIAEAIKTLSQASQELSTHVSVNGEGDVTIWSDYHGEELVFDTTEKLLQYMKCIKQMNSFVNK